MAERWAIGRFDLRLSDGEFWTMTPRQFYLLLERHRARLAHREICAGYTTAAVYNTAPFPPKEPHAASDYAPNHVTGIAAAPAKTDEQLAAESEFNCAVLEAGIRMREQYERQIDG